MCLCARSARTPPLPPGVCGVGVCAWAWVSAAPRHSWLGCWGLSVFVCELRSYPATPGWVVRFGCECLGSGFGCAPPLLAAGLGYACLCARSACTPPLLAGVCGVGVCAWARVLAGPRHSWLGCAVWMCVLGLGFRLCPATPCCGVGVRVCLCVHSACTPQLLARLCGLGLCAWAWVLSVPRHSWLGFVVCGFGVAWQLSSCRGSLCLAHALRVCGTRRPLLLRTCPCALVVAGGVPLWRAWWPGVVRRPSSGRVAPGAPVGFPDTVVPFPTLGSIGWLRGARGGRPRTELIVPAAGRCRGSGAGLAPRRTRSGPRDGVFPGESLWRRSWTACAAVVCVCGPGH